jgi:hypothetical protein
LNSAKLGSTGAVVLFEEAQSFPDDFTRGVVAARLDFGADEFFDLGSE